MVSFLYQSSLSVGSHITGLTNSRSRSQLKTKPLPVRCVSSQEDPEARFRTYGKDFGKRYVLHDLVDSAPRVRVRSAEDRARDQLADLAVLNERLAGAEGMDEARIRNRLEYLKRRRRNWELVYQFVTKEDAECTLAKIEEANQKVEQLLSEESMERMGVGALKKQLVELQREVNEAHDRLHLTQNRVQQNLHRISELKAEAARLAVAQQQAPAQLPDGSAASTATLLAAATLAAAPVQSAAPTTSSSTTAPSSIEVGSSSSRSRQRSGGGRGSTGARQPRRGLQSSLEFEDGLRNHWFMVQFSAKLSEGMMIPFDLFGEPWVLFRDEHGKPACIRDECAHRACPVSLGKVVNGQVECPYHGWRFNGEGACTKMPQTVLCRGVGVSALPCAEQDGFVWVWPGWEVPGEVPSYAQPPEGFTIHAELEMEVPVEHGLLVENLLDLAHAPFTHTTTFARGWPVPDSVKVHSSSVLRGYWDPYPITMSFEPPCVTKSLIGLKSPGKVLKGERAENCPTHLWQMHVCLPAKKGHTRLLYRMSTDFMGWTNYVPLIDNFWRWIAGKVLGEDLVLVSGQQDRLLRGADTWNVPVSYDKMGVRYRRWRNSMQGGAVAAEGLGLVAAEGQTGEAEASQKQGFKVVDDSLGVYMDSEAQQ